MNSFVATIAAVAIGGSVPTARTAYHLSPEAQAAQVRELYIDTDYDGEWDSACTVWHLSGEKWVTARHCVKDNPGATFTADGDLFTVTGQDENEDIATMRGPAISGSLKLANKLPKFGDKVHFIGYPWYEGTSHFGFYEGNWGGLGRLVNGDNDLSDGRDDARISIMVDGGASGSPLFNEAGEVVGVVVMSYRERPYSWAEPLPSATLTVQL